MKNGQENTTHYPDLHFDGALVEVLPKLRCFDETIYNRTKQNIQQTIYNINNNIKNKNCWAYFWEYAK